MVEVMQALPVLELTGRQVEDRERRIRSVVDAHLTEAKRGAGPENIRSAIRRSYSRSLEGDQTSPMRAC
jgi:hypothetical protein